MNSTVKLAATGFALVAVVALIVVIRQQPQLAGLKARHAGLILEGAAAPAPVLAVHAGVPGPGSLTPAERIELMQLRSRVTDLRERQRTLATVSNENASLQARLRSVSNQAAGRVPAGWIPRKDAKRAGTATPQAAFESFVWAIEHRDTNTMLQVMMPESLGFLKEQIDQGTMEAFWKSVGIIPGFRVKSATPQPDGTVLLDLELAPGADYPPVKAQLLEGSWRIHM